MAFDKLIIKGIVGAAKNGIKMDLAVDNLKEQLIDVVSGKIEDQIPVPLPFETRNVLKGNANLDSSLLTPDYINSLSPIPPSQKQQIENTLNQLEQLVNNTIVQKNALQGALSTITTPLTTIEQLADTLGGIITGVKVGVTVIKALPFPVSIVPGVGIPINIINGFSDSLDTLKTLIDKFGGPLEIVPKAIKQINNILIPIVQKLSLLDTIFTQALEIIAFIRLLLSLPTPITQSDVDQEKQSISNNIQESIAISLGEGSGIGDLDGNGGIGNGELTFPILYRGFILTLESDPDNTFSFPARRIKAENEAKVVLYSIPPDQGSGVVNTKSTYSYSSSLNVLVDEVKFNIDQYLLSKPQIATNISDALQVAVVSAPSSGTSGTSGTSSTPGYIPFGEPGTASGEVRFQGGKYWRYLGGTQDKWVEHTINLNPVSRKGVYDGEEYILRNNPPEPYPRSTYKWSDLFYKWMYQGTQT